MKTSSKATQGPSNERCVLDPQNWLKNHGDHLYNYALSRLGRHEQAEEAVQETLLAAVSSMVDFEGRSTERTWLIAILKSKIRNCIRYRWKLRKQLPLDEEVNPEKGLFSSDGKWESEAFPQVNCSLESRELWTILQLCLHKLPTGQAQVFVLRVLEEKNTEEICHELEISASNLTSRLYRARLGLARCMAENWSQ